MSATTSAFGPARITASRWWAIIAGVTGRVLGKPRHTVPTLSPTSSTSATASPSRAVIRS